MKRKNNLGQCGYYWVFVGAVFWDKKIRACGYPRGNADLEPYNKGAPEGVQGPVRKLLNGTDDIGGIGLWIRKLYEKIVNTTIS